MSDLILPALHSTQFPNVRLTLLDPLKCPYCRGWGYRFRREPVLEKYGCYACGERGVVRAGEYIEFAVWAGAKEYYGVHKVSLEVWIVNPWKRDDERVLPGMSEVTAYGPRSLERCAMRCVAERVWTGCGFEEQGPTLWSDMRVVAPYQWPDDWRRERSIPSRYESPYEFDLARRDGVVL